MQRTFTYCPPPAEVDYFITDQKLSTDDALGAVRSNEAGGVVLFSGEVRNVNAGKQVDHLYYEVYESMANKLIKGILSEAIQKFNLKAAYCMHKKGKMAIGECAVLVATSSIHRKEAYEANEYIIHRVKHEATIWKKEVYCDGTHAWGNNCSCC